MSCTVAISSPVFSPSRVSISSTLTCKAAAAAAEETLTRALSPSPSASSPSSPPFRNLRIAKPPLCGLIRASSSSSDCSALASSASPALWKRKRPASLDIPNVPVGFGDAPATPSVMEDLVEFEGDGYSVCCKRGRRGRAMEDRYSAMVDLHGDSKQAVFGVFDGHGGARAAEYASQNLTKNILGEVEKSIDEDIKEAVKNGYLKTDTEFLEQELRGGSCCVTALIRDQNMVVSNVGDCRAVVSRGGVAEALTSDHRASRADEMERIEASGGFVDCNCGVWRIQGSLAVSRAIGDRSLKQWVIAEPETRVVPLHSELEFLILASDGLWDKVSTQEAVDVARPFCIGSNKPQMASCCKRLVDLSVSRGSFDDVSVMLISLGHFL
ncbi:unnamed protein product [Cuscuta campestris]|uniref:protein-serine/threonine phosphatase n=2 Tax=Cuscuta sect. Cleistogrammica TaxID=1824901 RepID=A0A484L3U6_9ASTE|nr:hypothetical protein DM860_000041 [Cuscuta australis]VFQ70982.1 unnamed protein product [Cuscuta campestris]